MIWRASLASSRTVILLSGSGSPLELPKVDLVRPSSRARLVRTSLANLRSLPDMPSASAMQESLPLWMIAPCRRSSTGTLLLMAANIVEPPEGAPPLRQAFSLIRYSSVSLTLPSLIALKTTSAVISFIMLEGARSSSAFFSNRMLPEVASIRIAVGASPSKALSSFLPPCTLLLAAWTAPPKPIATTAAAASSRQTGRTSRNRCKNEGLAGIAQVPVERRSNSWSEQEQHGFCLLSRPVPARLEGQRIVPIVATLAPDMQAPGRGPGDVILPHDSGQRGADRFSE